jgi:ribonuclease G
MKEALLLSRTAGEVRVALVEDGRATAFYVDRERDRGVVGNVYLGRVVRVLPGMQAAFLDVGSDRSVFLYVGDIVEGREPVPASQEEDPDAEETIGAVPMQRPTFLPEPPDPSSQGALAGGATVADARIPRSRSQQRIEQLLRPGQELVVQISKAAMGTKGARVTTQLSLPGRFLVHLAHADHVGVSRRITDEAERDRLRSLVEELRAPGEGFIVRTACVGRTREELTADVEYLREVHRVVNERLAGAKAPALIHEELDLCQRSVRDLMSDRVERIVVDHPSDHRRVASLLDRFLPRYRSRLEYYDGADSLFVSTGVEKRLRAALERRVALPSGGHIVIDGTEALTAIDVNSGRYVGSEDLEATSLRVNLEATHVLVEELKVRDIGGIIVIDFIDMEVLENRERVYGELLAAVATDRARTQVLPISEFGLVEMTRRRVREDLRRYLLSPCEHCSGTGRLKSVETVAYEVLRGLGAAGGSYAGGELRLRCSKEVAARLREKEAPALATLERGLGATIVIQVENGWPRTRFSLSAAGRREASK